MVPGPWCAAADPATQCAGPPHVSERVRMWVEGGGGGTFAMVSLGISMMALKVPSALRSGMSCHGDSVLPSSLKKMR